MLFYSDAYKDNPYGRLHGDISTAWCTFEFSEGRIYHHEDNYVLAANFTKLENVVRSYKPEQALELPAKAIWTIHSKDYSTRKKVDGKYETISCKASIHEKLLYQHIEKLLNQHITDNPSRWLQEGKTTIRGKITHLNNSSYEMQGSNHQLPANSFQIEQIEPTGTLPEWTPPKNKGSWNNNNGGGVSIEDKEKFLRKELLGTIYNDTLKQSFTDATPISTLLWEINQQYKDNPDFLKFYAGILTSIVG